MRNPSLEREIINSVIRAGGLGTHLKPRTEISNKHLCGAGFTGRRPYMALARERSTAPHKAVAAAANHPDR
jgi:hypothetical protein